MSIKPTPKFIAAAAKAGLSIEITPAGYLAAWLPSAPQTRYEAPVDFSGGSDGFEDAILAPALKFLRGSKDG